VSREITLVNNTNSVGLNQGDKGASIYVGSLVEASGKFGHTEEDANKAIPMPGRKRENR